MAKTKINSRSVAKWSIALYYIFFKGAMDRLLNLETLSQLVLAAIQKMSVAFQAVDDAYKKSLASASTETIAELDDERDIIAMVMEQVAKQWARLKDAVMAGHGKRVAKVFKDFEFRASEALKAETGKILNMEQRFAEPELAADLAAMGLTEMNARLRAVTLQLDALMQERNEETAARVQGELKAAREAMDAAWAELVEVTNAVIVTTDSPELETLAANLNADIAEIERQIEQSKKLPTVLVDSKVVGNHRYSVPEFASWQTIVEQNEKVFAIDASTNRIVSLAPKASKVGGLYLTLGGVAVKPTDAVDAKKEYTLAYVKPQPEPTPVEPE